jgi:serine/threonine protein kinase
MTTKVKHLHAHTHTTEQQPRFNHHGSPQRAIQTASPSDLTEDLIITNVIGRGGGGVVFKAIHKPTKTPVAIKTASRPSTWQRLQKEDQILGLVAHHPNVCQVLTRVTTPTYYCMVLQYAPGGDLRNALNNGGPFSEHRARKLMKQLMSALGELHSKGIAHRDVKPDNLLFDDEEQEHLLLADFGLATYWKRGQVLTEYVGSQYWAAPELVDGVPYTGPEVDVWSAGCVLYAMLTGKVPFKGSSEERKRLMKNKAFKLPRHLEGPKDLLQMMLEPDPAQRATVQDVLAHPWMRDAATQQQLVD